MKSVQVRENNQKIQNSNIPVDDDPKFGAGSTFGKDVKEEAKRNKLGIIRKKYNPDAQPWLMRIGGKKDGRKYKVGKKEFIFNYVVISMHVDC